MTDPRQISVVIAEDEPIILHNIARKVEHCSNCFTVVSKASNGLEVMAFLQKQLPDILITDIEMPGMNGLELIKEMTARFPSVRIIILSGYNNFEYARTAMHYGVKEYLLKPVLQGDLNAILLRMAEEIWQDKKNRERNILSKAVAGEKNDERTPAGFAGKSFLLALITLGNLPSKYVQPHYSVSFSACFEKTDLAACIDSLPSVRHFWLIDEACCQQKFLILYTDREHPCAEHTGRILFNRIKPLMGKLPFHIVMADRPIPYREIWSCAKQLREYTDQTTSLHTQDFRLSTKEKREISLQYKEQKAKTDFLHQMTTIQELTRYISDTLHQYEKDKIPQQYVEHFLVQCYRSLPFLFPVPEENCQEAMNHALSSLQESTDLKQLDAKIGASLSELLLTHSTETNTESLSQKIRQYIDNHYFEEITAETLSKRYGYTPSYINRIFKKDSGATPLQYVTTLRMERAKELLLQDIDIKKIAAATGYEDARYFSRVFKNETGLTPSAWAAQAKK